ncbi:gliding motility lipoprotein GldD [Aurantibacter crassamenti]|uniref:gliding motility lipoprotein GldD n=1 Tax=Aurantibacter crassamenti TaxID=1837375 RepID=UPI00193A9896|nr:gliding motility lipoprotein GldD [Aurantibacter crassamenti]MBM1104848.1 gliding motility lipoprotein GldD [Aurantibacter crassamenti]
MDKIIFQSYRLINAFKAITILMLSVFILFGCKEDVLPKPKAQLRLDYPKGKYEKIDAGYYSFDKNVLAEIVEDAKNKGQGDVVLDYPIMKGSIFITHKKVKNNLQKLMIDAQKLSYEHATQADGIKPSEFYNAEEKIFGMYYEVSGDAASQAQFFVTDSTDNFVTGSLYFYVKPNYDSIYPAAAYLQNDIRVIMESLRWK